MSSLAKIFMFLSSYSPLYILTITLNYNFLDIKEAIIKVSNVKNIVYSDILLYGLFLLIVIPNVILYILISISKKYDEPIKLLKIEDGNEKVLDYILAYIVSFVTTDFPKIRTNDSKIVITAILTQILLGYLYCKGNMFYINPILDLMGYNIYIGKTLQNNVIILSKNKETIKDIKESISKNGFKNIDLNCFADNIYLTK
ncbi:hypothetical protein [Clostridium autoethanogenum]|uniref:Uncharacterized protein n=1 Tax=Clostridium autoethanogenum DSM 10061 TaxID=1341692 RepID=A0ABN4BCW8_9CLOT|nr:hypothetical protein [Clostridium autoethanogenum]AGY75319.2 hypothetical protein CAETHG_1094 [Clostridium autoethanogenum DSM 10061]